MTTTPAERRFDSFVNLAEEELAGSEWGHVVSNIPSDARRLGLPSSTFPALERIAVALVLAGRKAPVVPAGDLRQDITTRRKQVAKLQALLKRDTTALLPAIQLYGAASTDFCRRFDNARAALAVLVEGLADLKIPPLPKGARTSAHAIAVRRVVALCRAECPGMRSLDMERACALILGPAFAEGHRSMPSPDWRGRVHDALTSVGRRRRPGTRPARTATRQ